MQSPEHQGGGSTPEPAPENQQLDIMGEISATEPEAPKSGFVIPEKVRAQVEAAEADKEREIDRIDAQAQTTAGFGTRERAKALNPEDEDVIAGRAARKIVAQSMANPRPKPKRRGGWDPRGGGPPAHVAREMREGYPPEDDGPEAA